MGKITVLRFGLLLFTLYESELQSINKIIFSRFQNLVKYCLQKLTEATLNRLYHLLKKKTALDQLKQLSAKKTC